MAFQPGSLRTVLVLVLVYVHVLVRGAWLDHQSRGIETSALLLPGGGQSSA
jgi:hypothetical protein